MYAAVPGGDPGSSCHCVSDSVTVTGSVICIQGNCVFPFILVQNTLLLSLDACYLAFIILNFVSKLTCPE